ncbi:phage major capsid protein [Exiguobacterium profundum]|uniref:phage major capsid protein n=1 Tax=Exiguobacterium profundum TaxID=307643 RepID=UPI0029C3BE6C|nr:phage major capsid protein [Exiguobacterium profundum]MDX5982257.1 phage major capsid protein [Exiguobacterium profundum]
MPTFNPDNVLLMNARDGMIPTQFASEMVGEVVRNSAVMQLAQLEDMTAPKKVITYLAEGPGAYWVNEAERIQTSKATWLKAEMEAKKLAVIIPVSKEFLRYSVTDFFQMIRPKIAEAFYTKFDQAALFGTNSPYAAGQNILSAATTAGNAVALDDAAPLYGQLNGLLGLVEDNEIDPDGIATVRSMKQKFRGELDSTGRPIYVKGDGTAPDDILGLPLAYVNGKSFDKTKAVAFTGDWDYARFGILQDFEYEVSTDATLTTIADETGEPISLFERDMFALRVTAHFAFMVLKDEAFAALTPDVTP